MYWSKELNNERGLHEDMLNVKNAISDGLKQVKTKITWDKSPCIDFENSFWKFRKENWGRNMWAAIECDYMMHDNLNLEEVINRIANVDSGYILKKDGIIAKNNMKLKRVF